MKNREIEAHIASILDFAASRVFISTPPGYSSIQLYLDTSHFKSKRFGFGHPDGMKASRLMHLGAYLADLARREEKGGVLVRWYWTPSSVWGKPDLTAFVEARERRCLKK